MEIASKTHSPLVLVIKTGALGDVIRTQYFAESLHHAAKRVWWYAAPAAVPLVCHNPFIERVVTSTQELDGQIFDVVYSLDDELDCIRLASSLPSRAIEGLFLDNGRVVYSDNSAQWNDMGIRSRFGKKIADELKKANSASHAEIFSNLFGVSSANVRASFHNTPEKLHKARQVLGLLRANSGPLIVLNFTAGERWKSKELPIRQAIQLVERVHDTVAGQDGECLLTFDDSSRNYAQNLAENLQGLTPPLMLDTTGDTLLLAGIIAESALVVSADSFIMHLAIAQGVPGVAFFVSTSAQEIDDFGVLKKVIAQGPDSGTYKTVVDDKTVVDTNLLVAAFLEQFAKILVNERACHQGRHP